jgi:hypothetical protein
MKKAQLDKALRLAQSNADLSAHDINVFDGFGLPTFAPVIVTLPQVARLIRWQAVYLNGGVDNAALAEVADAGRRKFTVIGEGA